MTVESMPPMPVDAVMCTVNERLIRVPVPMAFALMSDVAQWPRYLAHYRFVRFRERTSTGGVVEMSANRPFGPLQWPTWWCSTMCIDSTRATIRFRHIEGITTGMDVEWTFDAHPDGTHVRIVHLWHGPQWPFIGRFAATVVIGPIFVHAIASRTLAGLAEVLERGELRSATGARAPKGARGSGISFTTGSR